MRRSALILLGFVGCGGCGHASVEKQVASEAEPGGIISADPALTESITASVRHQIEQHWLVNAGAPGIDKMVVRISIEMNPDGTVQSATIEDASSNPDWQKFAESCRRAIYKSSPFQMPAGKPYALWKRMTLIFDAREMVRQ